MSILSSISMDFQAVPSNRPVGVLMRHSARFPILDPEDPYQAELTEEGVRMAEDLGKMLRSRFQPGRQISSPVNRCVATCEAIAQGAGWPVQVQTDERISHPFISPVWYLMEKSRGSGVTFQVKTVLRLMLASSTGKPGLDLLVTHDTVVGAVVGNLLRAPIMGRDWPGYLEGVFAWRAAGGITLRWRGSETRFSEDFSRIE